MNWPPVFHLQWLGHVPHGRQHLPTTIVWSSLMRELISSVMVSSPLLLAFGTLSLLLYFQLPSTFLPSKGRSITTLGTRWHDFFYYSFYIFYKMVLFFTLHFFSFSQGMQTRERAHCACSVFPFIKKKKKKIQFEGGVPIHFYYWYFIHSLEIFWVLYYFPSYFEENGLRILCVINNLINWTA